MEPSPDPLHSELPVFVYGTLKAGFENHERYCQGVTEVAPARTWGRFHEWAPGIPILDVPRTDVLLRGSTDILADLDAAREVGLARPVAHALARRLPGRWRRVHGQLLRFPDPVRRLGLFDALEGFQPATGQGYERVLLLVAATPEGAERSHVVPAWCYVLPPGRPPPGPALKGVSWEPRSG